MLNILFQQTEKMVRISWKCVPLLMLPGHDGRCSRFIINDMYVHICLYTFSYSFFSPRWLWSFQSLYICLPRISQFQPPLKLLQLFNTFEREILLFNIVWIKLLILHNSYISPVIPHSSPYLTWHECFSDRNYTFNSAPRQIFYSVWFYCTTETEFLILLSTHLNLTLLPQHFSLPLLTSTTGLMPTHRSLLQTQVSFQEGSKLCLSPFTFTLQIMLSIGRPKWLIQVANFQSALKSTCISKLFWKLSAQGRGNISTWMPKLL